ncbi:MAG TPA: hypothetical protein VFQ45_15345 [Longimicrobium sp.]|nr:hypothetical protein [Longimicrobium sp.]
MLRRLLLSAALLAAALAPRALPAQEPAPLQNFIASVARLWAAGDAEELAELAADGSIILDLGGDGPGSVQPRNAAAALRRLFGDRDNVSVRPRQVTLSGGTPVRGFGELTWVSRPRGVTESLTSVVYVGAVWERGAWRLRELRLLR